MFKIIVGILLTIVSANIFLGAVSIDKTIINGEINGFEIGASREKTFKTILESTKNTKYNNRIVLFNAELKALKKPLILHEDIARTTFDNLEDKSEWTFFYDSHYFFDSITFYFCKGSLCKIRRKRALFEWSY